MAHTINKAWTKKENEEVAAVFEAFARVQLAVDIKKQEQILRNHVFINWLFAITVVGILMAPVPGIVKLFWCFGVLFNTVVLFIDDRDRSKDVKRSKARLGQTQV